MSFYGQVVYEFTKLFSKFTINNGTTLEAEDMWDEIKINGDHWVSIQGSKDADKEITFSHGDPQEKVDDTKTCTIFEVIEEPTETPTLLEYGSKLQFKTPTFDTKGHCTGEDAIGTYQLPPALALKINDEENIILPSMKDDNNRTITLKGDEWIGLKSSPESAPTSIEFSHKMLNNFDKKPDFTTFQCADTAKRADSKQEDITAGAPDGTATLYEQLGFPPVYILRPGELIKTYTAKYDDNGHLGAVNTQYFKLPISADTAMFEKNSERILDLENRLSGQKDTDGPLDKEYEKIVEDLYKEKDGLYARVDTLESNSVQKEGFTGELTDMYEEGNEKTFAETIGKVDSDTEGSIRSSIRSLLALQSDEEPEKIYTIAEAIFYLSKKLQEADVEIYNLRQANRSIKIDIENLTERIEKLENPTE